MVFHHLVWVLGSTVVLAAQPPASRPTSGWIWSQAGAEKDAPSQELFFRYELRLAAAPSRAELSITADNSFELLVNGDEAAGSVDWQRPIRVDIAPLLKEGQNVLACHANNTGGPGGLYVEGSVTVGNVTIPVSSGSDWWWSEKAVENWTGVLAVGSRPSETAAWKPAVVLGPKDMAPWNFPALLPNLLQSTDWKVWRERQRHEMATTSRPADPSGEETAHVIDRFMSAWWAENKIAPPSICDDATFARRAYFDILGLPPTEAELHAFLKDNNSDKRVRLVDRLLADELGYAQGWMAYWCDLLRNDEQTNIDGLRKPITKWLFAALRSNKPYDQMIAELLNPGPGGPDGYLKGVNWRGVVNASQRPPVQAAQNVGQVFLATNIKCASCHDHFTKPYLLEDAYGLASFFSETNLEIYRCDKPTGQVKAPEFLLHDLNLGKIAPDANLATRLRAICEMVTSPRNPRFAPTMVNRFWKKLMGRGLFEPVDDFSGKVANKPLLDWLAYDFMAHDYDLKVLIRLLMTSRAYQLKSITESPEQMSEWAKQPPVYVGPPVRRLTSEQYLDAVSRLTGHWPSPKVMDVQVADPNVRAWRHQMPDSLARALGRPNREQVTTLRMEEASMLQMLEMTNGQVLADRLTDGVKVLLASPLGKAKTDAALDALYLRGLGRPAHAVEHETLGIKLGTPKMDAESRRPGWEDVCWVIVMGPEFQFIY